MAAVNSTVKPRRKRLTPARLTACYGIDADAVSFRHGLSVCERGVIDEAVSIIERCIKSAPAFDTPDAVKKYLQLQLAGDDRLQSLSHARIDALCAKIEQCTCRKRRQVNRVGTARFRFEVGWVDVEQFSQPQKLALLQRSGGRGQQDVVVIAIVTI